MSRRVVLVTGFLFAAALLAGALLWISRTALALEAGQAEARRRADLEERARLALWRMDAAVATLLSQENTAPLEWRDTAPTGLVRLRFEIDAKGKARLAGGVPQPTEVRLDRDLLLAALAQEPLVEPLPAPAPQIAAAEPVPSPPPTKEIAAKEAPSKQASAPLEAEMESQMVRNTVEFEQRVKANAAQQSQLIGPSGDANPPYSVEGVTIGEESPPPPAAAPWEPATRPEPRQSEAPVSRPAPRPARSQPETRLVSTVQPVWSGDELLLVRRVSRRGSEVLQGVWVDRRALAQTLEAEVQDLLPQASVEPVLSPAASDPGRQLALLPLKLAPGELPAVPSAGWSPARIGLALSSATIVVVLAATGLLLLGSLRLARRRADFVSAVTHELRTPLTTFRLYTEMLSEDMVPVPDRPSYLATLRHESERLSHLVENVLAFSRLERRKSEPQLEEVELGCFLDEVLARLERAAESAGMKLSSPPLSPEQSLSRVRIDRVAGERILQNLIDNSCKYGRNGHRPEVELRCELRERHVILAVRDFGPGLTRKDRRRIFRPFHKSAARAAATAPGVGLGLALSRRLARSFGGDLRCTEPEGGGAAFELWLPLSLQVRTLRKR